MTDGLPGQQDRRPGDGAVACPGVPAPSSQSATRWATPPDITPPSAQASMATAGPPRPRSAVRASSRARAVQDPGGHARARRPAAPWTTAMPPKVVVAGQAAVLRSSRGATSRRTRRRAPAGRGRRAAARRTTSGRSSVRSSRRSLRPVRQTTHTTAAARRTTSARQEPGRATSRSGVAAVARSSRAAAAATRGGDGEQAGGGVRGAQPGDEPAAVPEAGQAERGAFGDRGVAGGAGQPRRRGGGFVGAPSKTNRTKALEFDRGLPRDDGSGH